MMEFYQTLQTHWYPQDEHLYEKYRLNFGEVDIAPVKIWKMTKLTKWKINKN